MGGVGYPNHSAKQGTAKTIALLRNYRNHRGLLPDSMKIAHKWLYLYAGCTQFPLKDTKTPMPHLLEGWFSNLRKISPRQTKEISIDYWNSVRKLMKDARKAKPHIARGEDCYGMSNRYICFGQRKEPKSKKVGEYSFLPQVPSNVQDQFTKGIQELVSKMESIGQRVIRGLPDTALFKKIKKSCNLKSLGKGATTQVQFSIGYQYWSKIHCDQDYFYTLLSGLSKDPEDHNDILYYFCFPEYNFMVPMRSGDLLWFNPLVEHCCTNSSKKEAMIFSAYVSRKTVLTVASDKFENK